MLEARGFYYNNVYWIETRAYELQNRLVADELARVPCYATYLSQMRRAHGYEMVHDTPDAFVRLMYAVEPAPGGAERPDGAAALP